MSRDYDDGDSELLNESPVDSRPPSSSAVKEGGSVQAAEKQSQEKWLLAHTDTSASLYTHTACICFTDLHGDGDQKLVIADLGDGVRGMKLNIYKGTSMLSQLTLIECPCGVVSFHMESNEPRVPALGVTSGSYLYIYKSLKPFYKFSLPGLDANQIELEAWNNVRENKIDSASLMETLELLKNEIGESNMTARSQALLDLKDSAAEEFIRFQRHQPMKRQNTITCVAIIKKTVEEENNLNCIIIGTENRDIFIIEPDAFTILASVQLPSVPVFMEITGLFNVEYRVIVSCRDANIYIIKRGFKTGRLCVQLNSQPVGLSRANNNIIVATMDRTLSSYTVNGNRTWKITESCAITTIAAFEIEILGLTLIAVALESNWVHLYNGKEKVDAIEMDDVIVSMKFGRYGREDNTLVMVSRRGHLIIKILKRTAKFVPIDADLALTKASSPKLNIPKKNKLFMDQAMREKDEAISIHRTFQNDLYRLRLVTARSYVKALTSSLNPISSNALDPLKLSAQVHGLGPIFRLILEVQNTSLDQPSTNLCLVFSCDVKIYRISRNFIPVPYLSPGLIFTYATKVECVNELNISDFIKIYVLREHENVPLITAVINMPPSESPL